MPGGKGEVRMVLRVQSRFSDFIMLGFQKNNMFGFFIISSALLRFPPYPQEPEAHFAVKERFKDSGSSMASGPRDLRQKLIDTAEQ